MSDSVHPAFGSVIELYQRSAFIAEEKFKARAAASQERHDARRNAINTKYDEHIASIQGSERSDARKAELIHKAEQSRGKRLANVAEGEVSRLSEIEVIRDERLAEARKFRDERIAAIAERSGIEAPSTETLNSLPIEDPEMAPEAHVASQETLSPEAVEETPFKPDLGPEGTSPENIEALRNARRARLMANFQEVEGEHGPVLHDMER